MSTTMKISGKERISKLPTHFISNYQSLFNFCHGVVANLRSVYPSDTVSYVISPSNIIGKNCHFRIDFTVLMGCVPVTRSLRVILLYSLFEEKPFIHCGFQLDLFIESFDKTF